MNVKSLTLIDVFVTITKFQETGAFPVAHLEPAAQCDYPLKMKTDYVNISIKRQFH